MHSKTTINLKSQASKELDGINTHLVNLINKLGSERTNRLLSALSSDGVYASYDAILKELTASYFSIPVEEVVSGSTHWHAQVRGVCFFILNKNKVSVRSIGSFFGKKESAVHSQIKLMESIIDRPSKDKSFFKAYTEIDIQFERFIAVSPDKEEQVITELVDYDKVRTKLKSHLKNNRITHAFLSTKSKVPRTAITMFLNGTRKMRLENIIKIESYLNIKLYER